MGERVTTTWTCEMCKKEVVLDGADKQPRGWVRVYLASPPRATPSPSRTMCDECEKVFAGWLFGQVLTHAS